MRTILAGVCLVTLVGCAAWASQPDSAARARAAERLAQCVDTVITQYRQETAADAGVPAP